METPINITEEITTVTIGEEISMVTIEETVTVIETDGQWPPWPPWPPWDGSSSSWEIPIGTINWINTNFALAYTPVNWIRVYVNGMRQKNTIDYTISSNIISFIVPLIPWDILLADYNY